MSTSIGDILMETISFCPRTKQLIASMAKINQGLLFLPGNLQKSCSGMAGQDGASIYINATFQEEIPCKFGISDLTKLLNVLSLYDEPTITIDKGRALIIKGKSSGANRQYQFTISAENIILHPNDAELDVPEPLNEFDLSLPTLQTLTRHLAVANLDQVNFASDGKTIYIVGIPGKASKTNSSEDMYTQKIGPSENKFNVQIETPKILSMMENEYHVSICERMLVFKGPDITYFFAPKIESTYS